MNKTLLAVAILGMLAVAALIGAQGFGAVGAAFASVGLGALVVIALRALQIAGAGLAWWCLLPRDSRPAPWVCMRLRWVREAINTLLPVAQVGGEIAGARLLARHDVGNGGGLPDAGGRLSGGLAGASVLVDLLTQTATQVVFAALGLALLAAGGRGDGLVSVIGIGLGLMGLGTVGFYLAQRLGGFGILERGLLKAAERPGFAFLGGASNLNAELQVLHRAPGQLWQAVALHFAMWFIGALEVFFALRFMGVGAGFPQALVIESLGQAIRAAAFLIPGGLGAQEGGLIALCAVYGISAPIGLALSLVKRVPEIVLGLPGLLVWHWLESGSGAAPAGSRTSGTGETPVIRSTNP